MPATSQHLPGPQTIGCYISKDLLGSSSLSSHEMNGETEAQRPQSHSE